LSSSASWFKLRGLLLLLRSFGSSSVSSYHFRIASRVLLVGFDPCGLLDLRAVFNGTGSSSSSSSSSSSIVDGSLVLRSSMVVGSLVLRSSMVVGSLVLRSSIETEGGSSLLDGWIIVAEFFVRLSDFIGSKPIGSLSVERSSSCSVQSSLLSPRSSSWFDASSSGGSRRRLDHGCRIRRRSFVVDQAVEKLLAAISSNISPCYLLVVTTRSSV